MKTLFLNVLEHSKRFVCDC